eukprot:278542_1
MMASSPQLKLSNMLLLSISTLLFTLFQPIQASNGDNNDEGITRPFLTRDLEVAGVKLPVTPMTLIIGTISFYILFSNLTKESSATASHILLDDASDASRKKLEKMKAEIKNDPAKFASYAAKHSTCPSGKSGSPNGSLGKFKLGMMVPPFDKAVFSPKNKVGEVLGPIQTQFGWHLILIHSRDEQRQLIAE